MTIIDQYNRIHDYLRISLTERCNLRCFYCMPEKGILLSEKSMLMSKDEIIAIAGEFVKLGVKKIRLTGGEPLLRKDAAEIITALSQFPVELTLTTNGILVDNFIDVFKQAGIKHLNVSLDSLQPEKMSKITRRDYFDRIMNNVNLLIENNFIVKINTVLIRGVNDDEIIDFIAWTQNKPVHVRFIEFMPFDGNKWDWSKGVSLAEILNILKREFDTVEVQNVIKLIDHKNDTSKNYKIKGFEGTFAVISSVTNPFCDSCNRIRLTADGKIKNCLFSNHESNLLQPLREGTDIKPIILESVFRKKATRGGMISFDDFSNPDNNQNNRSMVAIGG